MDRIVVEQLTKDYGLGRGIFKLDFKIGRGEAVGFLGPNGAGKTTTIRHLMGFLNPDGGSCQIDGIDCMSGASRLHKRIGYLPGELAFMEDMDGESFIRFIASMRHMTSLDRARALQKRLEINPKGKIRKMSKGMKQKIGLICALMDDPDLLILDEPTSGLDPLMQNLFVELIQEEKKKGTTIFMSSHMFDEVEKTCDRVLIIKNGTIAADENIDALKNKRRKIFRVTFIEEAAAQAFARDYERTLAVSKAVAVAEVLSDMMPFIHAIGKYTVTNLERLQLNLEEIFMQYYGGGTDVL